MVVILVVVFAAAVVVYVGVGVAVADLCPLRLFVAAGVAPVAVVAVL